MACSSYTCILKSLALHIRCCDKENHAYADIKPAIIDLREAHMVGGHNQKLVYVHMDW